MKIKSFILAVLIFFTSGSLCGAAGSRGAPEKNKAAFDFTLSDLKDNKISLSSFSDRPVMLFFWTTWCPYCRTELKKLSEEYSRITKKAEVLAINIGEPKKKVEKFIEGRDIKFPVLLDSESKVASIYGLIGVPTFILIDSQGLIKFNANQLPEDYFKDL